MMQQTVQQLAWAWSVCTIKKETTITKLRDMMGTDLKGTNLIGLSKCAEELGFNCQAVKVDKEGFVSRYTLPAIANIVTKEGLSHFVVIFRITKKYVIIGDPAKDLERLTIDEFYKKFTGAMLLLKPNSEFEREKIKGTKLFDRYIKLLLPQKKLFIYALVASLLVTLLGILSSLFNNIIYDEILPYQQKRCIKDDACGISWNITDIYICKFCETVDSHASVHQN